MRVSHVITRLVVGGAQENTVSSVLGLREIPGVDVDLISGPTTGPEGTLEPSVAKFPGLLTIVPDLVRPVKPWQDWMALRELEQIFRRFKPDIVHTHSGKAGVVGRLAAHRAGVPEVARRRSERLRADRAGFGNSAITTDDGADQEKSLLTTGTDLPQL